MSVISPSSSEYFNSEIFYQKDKTLCKIKNENLNYLRKIFHSKLLYNVTIPLGPCITVTGFLYALLG